MRARPAAAGLIHRLIHRVMDGRTRLPLSADAADGLAGAPVSARVAEARSRASERRDRQRQVLRPLGWAFIAVVVVTSMQEHPLPGLAGTRLGVSIALAGYVGAVTLTLAPGWARRGVTAQVAMIGLVGGCGVALAALQPHGPAGLAASIAVWIAAVRLPPLLAAAMSAAIIIPLGLAIGLTERPAAPAVAPVTLLCLLLAVTGQFIRRSRDSQDRTELLLAQLQDARDGEAAAAALAERGRIAGELHDVLAHSLSGLAIQLQGARKLAERESASPALRATIARSAALATAGLGDARQAVGALRGDPLPTVAQLSALVEEFRRDTGADAAYRIEGTPRPLAPEAGLALYRGAQEALTNIIRYAPGAAVTIIVRYATDRAFLSIEDHRPLPGCKPADRPRWPKLTGAGGAGGAGGAEGTGSAGSAAGACGAATGGAGGGSASDIAGGGYGLTAMRERAGRAGGTARAGPTGEGWLVELEVPA